MNFRFKNVFVCILLGFLIAALNCTNVFAFNEDYLNADKWNNNPNVTFSDIDINSSSRSGKFNIRGVYGYYADCSNMSVYNYFAVEETPASAQPMTVSVLYTFKSQNEKYIFLADENGITQDSEPQAKNIFKVNAKFYPERQCFISAVDYKGKETVFNIDVKLVVNERVYAIDDSLYLEKTAKKSKEKLSSGKQSKKSGSKSSSKKGKSGLNSAKKRGKNSHSDKSGKEKTTKFVPKRKYTSPKAKSKKHSSSKSDAKSANSNRETVSKFSPSGTDLSAAGSSEIYRSGKAFNDSSAELSVHPEKTSSRMSHSSLVLLICAIVAASSGLTLIATALASKQKTSINNSSGNDGIKEDKDEEKNKES